MTPIIIALLIWAQPTTADRELEVIAIGEAIEYVAITHGYDPWRLAALTVRESGVRLDRVGKLGERGPGQVMAKYLPGISNEDLSHPLGGMIGVVEALDSWKRDRPRENPWACFASGNKCRAPRSIRRLRRIEERLRGMAQGYEAGRSEEAGLDDGWVSR